MIVKQGRAKAKKVRGILKVSERRGVKGVLMVS